MTEVLASGRRRSTQQASQPYSFQAFKPMHPLSFHLWPHGLVLHHFSAAKLRRISIGRTTAGSPSRLPAFKLPSFQAYSTNQQINHLTKFIYPLSFLLFYCAIALAKAGSFHLSPLAFHLMSLPCAICHAPCAIRISST